MQKNIKIAIVVATIVCVVSTLAFAQMTETDDIGVRLEKFCNGAREYPNHYNFSEEEQLAFGLSSLVRDELAFYLADTNNLSLSKILDEKRGSCREHTLLFLSCCEVLDLNCVEVNYVVDWDINVFNNKRIPSAFVTYHFFATVTINGDERYLDPSASESFDLYMFNDVLLFDGWDVLKHNELLLLENEQNYSNFS